MTFDPDLIEHICDSIEDAVYTKFGPFEPNEIEAAMSDIIAELSNRWTKGENSPCPPLNATTQPSHSTRR